MKTRASKIISCIIFLSILLFVLCKITWLFRGNEGEARENIVGLRNQGDVDVVFYGGSNILRFYQPLEAWNLYGFTSYDYGTASAKADLLKNYIVESRKENEALLYVCDIRSIPLITENVDDMSVRNWSDSVTPLSANRVKGISSFLFRRNWQECDIPSFYVDIIKYHTNYDALKEEYQWRYLHLDNVYNQSKGFYPSENHTPYEEPIYTDARGTLSPMQEKALRELLDYCKCEELNVLFTVCPYILSESDWETFNLCGDIIDEYGFDYINFNEYSDEIGIDYETDYSDDCHMNFLGAEKYTKYLATYLKENYNLPDHRDDGTYAKWNEDYLEFSQHQASWRQQASERVAAHLELKFAGNQLSKIDSFEEWNEAIADKEYSIIMTKNSVLPVGVDENIQMMLDNWGVDMSQDYYVGIWTQGEFKYFQNGVEGNYQDNIGRTYGRDERPLCTIKAGKCLQIDDEEYYNQNADIQIVVFDDVYLRVVDSVCMKWDDNGEVKFYRE